MPYKDQEARKQASRDSMKRKREGLTSGLTSPGVNSEGLTDEAGTLSDEEIKGILQHWLDYRPTENDDVMTRRFGKIRVCSDVAEYYDLDQRYGSERVTAAQLCDQVNAELAAKKIDSTVFLWGRNVTPSQGSKLPHYHREMGHE